MCKLPSFSCIDIIPIQTGAVFCKSCEVWIEYNQKKKITSILENKNRG